MEGEAGPTTSAAPRGSSPPAFDRLFGDERPEHED